MFKKAKILLTFTVICFSLVKSSFARDFIIYSIGHELPMGNETDRKIKNFYINIGGAQGVKEGTVLDVFRFQSELNPYESNKRYNYKIKIGQLKVIHSDSEAAIGRIEKMREDEDLPLLEFKGLMIGDHVGIHVR